ncbi:MAG: glycosyltransferase [Bryobacteraceae bacterium]
MRILQLIESAGNSAVVSQSWLRNLHEPLLDLGCKVDLISTNPARTAWRSHDSRKVAEFNDRVLTHFRREHARDPFDMLFAYVVDGMLDPAVIAEIRRAGVVAVNFSCNNCHQFYLVREISKHFDYNLHSEGDRGDYFVQAGAKPLWWPMASNPKYFHPYEVPRNIPVSFVGANYALRARYIAYLLEHGIDVHAYGPTWRFAARTRFRAFVKRWLLLAKSALARTPESRATASALLAGHDFNIKLDAAFRSNLHAPVSDEELIRFYSRSHISLGFIEVYERNDPSREIRRHTHLREFEAPMSGALYCTGHVDELTHFFEPGREIITYRSEEELLSQVRWLLDHPGEAERIRRAGHRRALAEHTYHHRFETLFRAVGLHAPRELRTPATA